MRQQPRRRIRTVLPLFLVVLSFAPTAGASASPWRGWRAPERLDAHPPARLAVRERRDAEVAAGLYDFVPQSGRLGRDIYAYNYVDLDPGFGDAAIRDWDCSRYTYDGHGGHDLMIRGFREQAIGVPVFAALGGDVIQVVDHHPDDSIDTTPKPNNVIVLDHGEGHRTIYYHVRRGSALVAVGETVVAGQQIASVASSGVSTGPHLHFETRVDGFVVEPSAGPCRGGDSLWRTQEPVSRSVYLREAFFSLEPFPLFPTLEDLWRAILVDERSRLSSAVVGMSTVYLWVEFFNLPGASQGRLRLFDPKGALRHERTDTFGVSEFARVAYFDLPITTTFDRSGEWRVVFDVLAGSASTTVLDTLLRVVATPKAAKNRAPVKVAVRLGAPRANVAEPTVCTVETSLTGDDPDHDLVSYFYEWRVGNRRARAVHSAALTDLLPAGAASAADRVRCRVRPFDGTKFGPATEARTR